MRLIDADALREGWLEWDIYDEIEANTVLYSIDDQPTINPEDLRPKGKWEEYIDEDECWGRMIYPRCSRCQWIDMVEHKFCPNCGAQMEE